MEESVQTLALSWPLLVLWASLLPLFFLGTWLLRRSANAHRPSGTPVYTMSGAARLNAEAIRRGIGRTAATVGASQMIKFVIAFAIGAVVGYLYRDHVLFQNEFTITQAEIIENQKRGDGWYGMRLIRSHKEFPARFCPGTPEFPLGTVFDEIKYEDRGWCWSISSKKLGFVINMEETHVRTAER